MLTGFQLTPDGDVYVRNNGTIYADTKANFETDYGQAVPALPNGILQQLYEPGKRHFYADADGVVGGGSMPWGFGDAAIAATNNLLTAQATRLKVEAPVPVEPQVRATPRQIRLALNQLGLRSAVDAYIAQADQTTRDNWEYATTIERNNALIATAAAVLNKTTEEVDNLFALAKTL